MPKKEGQIKSGADTPPKLEQSKIAKEINDRASSASPKIKEQVNEIIIPNINQMGTYAEMWLNGMQGDFYTLVENPDDECGGGNYTGWTAEEIKELYYILYGQKMN